MTVEDLLPRLDAVRRSSRGFVARCPAHADKSPSLAIKEGERGLLVKCWAGCTLQEICVALGIEQRELFFDAHLPRGPRPVPHAAHVDRRALAFRYELHALDLRLRGEKVLTAATNLECATLTNNTCDRLMNAVASAYEDRDRGELFEHVADTLRGKDWDAKKERRHAA